MGTHKIIIIIAFINYKVEGKKVLTFGVYKPALCH